MKRMLAIVSVALMAGCAFALADSSDSANSDAMNSTSGITSQDTTTTTHSKKTAKMGKTCTDENGDLLKKGEAGFKACWNAQHPKQESGVAADQKTDENKMDQNTMDQNVNPSDNNH